MACRKILRAADGLGDGFVVMAIDLDERRQPAARKRAGWSIDVEREVGPSIEIELSSQKTISRRQSQMTGEIDRLVADAFLQAAIAGDHVGVVIDDIGAETGREHALGQRHADGGRMPLPERARRRLDAQRVADIPDGRRCGCRAGGMLATARSAYPRSRVR